MFKKPISILMLSLLWLTSCSQGDEPSQARPDESAPMHKVEMGISRAAQDEFLAAGIDKFTIYVYCNDRKNTSLYKEQEISVGSERFSLELPLGDNFQTFAVAGATVTDKESFETVSLQLDPAASRDVWMSTPVKFASDKSVSSVDLTLRRVVARVEFEPAETAAELAAQSSFDRLDLTFGGVATTYNVSKSCGTAADYSVSVNASTGYKAGFYTFETSTLDTEASLAIIYYKGGAQVNTSAGTLETGLKFAANNRYTVIVPVTSPDFMARPMSARGKSPMTFTVTKSAL